jgi:hypothetical protein
MILLLFFAIVTLILRALGLGGVHAFEHWSTCLRFGLAAMFVLSASAHWGKRRPDLIRIVPAAFGRPDLAVTATGILELLGAAGLLFARTAPSAGFGAAARRDVPGQRTGCAHGSDNRRETGNAVTGARQRACSGRERTRSRGSASACETGRN